MYAFGLGLGEADGGRRWERIGLFGTVGEAPEHGDCLCSGYRSCGTERAVWIAVNDAGYLKLRKIRSRVLSYLALVTELYGSFDTAKAETACEKSSCGQNEAENARRSGAMNTSATTKIKKYVLPNLPYALIFWFCNKVGTAYRIAPGEGFNRRYHGRCLTLSTPKSVTWQRR